MRIVLNCRDVVVYYINISYDNINKLGVYLYLSQLVFYGYDNVQKHLLNIILEKKVTIYILYL